MEYETTLQWLQKNVKFPTVILENILRNGSTWKCIAGMHSFSIYSDGLHYCAHAGDEWLPDTEPLFGYFDISLDHDYLLRELAIKYDTMANDNFQRSNTTI
jgi:hypothetical protein